MHRSKGLAILLTLSHDLTTQRASARCGGGQATWSAGRLASGLGRPGVRTRGDGTDESHLDPSWARAGGILDILGPGGRHPGYCPLAVAQAQNDRRHQQHISLECSRNNRTNMLGLIQSRPAWLMQPWLVLNIQSGYLPLRTCRAAGSVDVQVLPKGGGPWQRSRPVSKS